MLYAPTVVTPPSTPSAINAQNDLVEDVLQQCKRNAEERKKKILAAYEAAARSAPSGVVKGVDFEPFINADGMSNVDDAWEDRHNNYIFSLKIQSPTMNLSPNQKATQRSK